MMRAKIKNEEGKILLELPLPAAILLSTSGEAEVLVLRDGVLLIAPPGLFEKMISNGQPPILPASAFGSGHPAPRAASISDEEAALLRKLSAVRFEERTPPSIEKSLSAVEKNVLATLIERKLITLFKSEKYSKGVYNISQTAYLAGIHATPGVGKTFIKTTTSTSPVSSPNIPAALVAPAPAVPYAHRSPLPPGAPPINTVEHLISLGYMVLDNENEAKRVMSDIQSKLKNDDVKGVRGFDRRYYVLRRSFLMEFEGPVLALVDQGPCAPEELGAKLNLTSEAVRVLLMILGDEGEVIEKRRGHWVRA